jgi:hypothetical protein
VKINDSRQRAYWLAACLLSALALLWIALANGFPIFFPDSGTYMALGVKHQISYDRPVTYGVVIALLYHAAGLWAVPIVQSAFTIWILKRTIDVTVGRCTPLMLFATCALLALFSSLPWFVGQVMTDLFPGLICLLLYLIVFAGDRLGRIERRILPVILFGLICFHLSHLPLTAALICASALLALAFRKFGAARRGLISATIALVAAVMTLCSINLVLDRQFKPSLMGSTFILARLLDARLAQGPLVESCKSEKLSLCAYVPMLELDPKLPGQYYAFGPKSPKRALEHADWHRIRDEEALIVHRTIAANPGGVVKMAIEGWGRQLVTAKSADEMTACDPCRPIIEKYFPRSWPAYQRSLQERNLLPGLAFMPIGLIAIVIAIAMPAIIYGLLRRRRNEGLAILGGLIVTLLLINAAICSMLAGIFDRFQNRVLWVLPFFAILSVIWAVKVYRSPQDDGAGASLT